MTPIELTTARLRLRRGRPSDAPALFAAYTGSEERSRYLARGVHARIEQTEGFLRTWCDARWDEPDASFAWVLADLATNERIGTFVVVRQGHIAEVHFGLDRARSGQGLATEALIAVTQWLESSPVIQRIWTACDVEHLASQGVLAKAGYRPEGVLRKWLVLPAFGPEARDCLAFARVCERSNLS